MSTTGSAILIATMAVVTMATRFVPFLVIRGETPEYVSYLGRVLPPAIIGMLVVYCLRDVSPAAYPFGLPELVAVVCVIAVQAWRRNSLASILAGTVVYMVLVRVAL